MNFQSCISQPFLYVNDEMPTFHKFIYHSQKDLKSTLKCSVVLNFAPKHELVYIHIDLYRQTNPPSLSPHVLVERHCDANKVFVIDTLLPCEPGNELRKYTLQNFHVLNVPKKRREECLLSKMKYFLLWKSGREQLTDEESFALRNRTRYESFEGVTSDDKVYIGFTAYVHDPNTNSKRKYAETEFSSAIYDCNNSLVLYPFLGSRYGGSVHELSMDVAVLANIQIHLCDESGWSAAATEVQNLQGSIGFRIPSYTGCWHDDDDTRLVQLKVIVNGNMCKKPIKFLYTRT